MDLTAVRRPLAGIYRGLMIVVGLIGLTAAGFLLRAHTPANMQGLPGGIIALLSLGALLEGLTYRRAMAPDDPIDPGLLDKTHVRMTTGPLPVSLSESDMRRAAGELGRGMSIADAARAVYPGYDGLEELEKRALESALDRAVKAMG